MLEAYLIQEVWTMWSMSDALIFDVLGMFSFPSTMTTHTVPLTINFLQSLRRKGLLAR